MAKFFLLIFLLLLLLLLLPLSMAEIRSSEIRSDSRSIIPFAEFRFTPPGVLELNVSHLSLSNSSPELDLSSLGFFLSTGDSWLHVLGQMQDGEITCALQSSLVKLIYTFNNLPAGAHSFDISFSETHPGQFTLFFANCLPQLQISMDVRSAIYNVDQKTNRRDYLCAGSTVLPRVHFPTWGKKNKESLVIKENNYVLKGHA
ncbi:hypothetical protein AAC387_Pa06g1250 [Persea americana]